MTTEHIGPSGAITFLFSDIEQSTLLWERHGEQMRTALAHHDVILRTAVEQHGGHVVKTTGDGLLAVFESAAAALQAALDAQRHMQAEPWEAIAPDILRVRMGLHQGDAQFRAGDYYGTAVNRAARIMDLGHGGQILISSKMAELQKNALPPGSTLRDMGRHPLRGLHGEEHVFQLAAPDLQSDFPPLRSGRILSGNLPAHVSSFIGRMREMAEVRAALSDTRLLTLTGPGGTGKTRLSLQVALDVQPAYEHGAWIVELAPLTDPALVTGAAANVFGLKGQSSEETRQMLFDYLREKELLLVLDNCEHLVEACARLAADLIAACPHLTVLASSREGLSVYGETTYHLPTLNLPPANGETAESAARSEAVQLFVERAAAALPGFKLTNDNAPAVAQIVRRLDGIPLAIELAAARLKFFSVEQVAARLDDRFRLLTGGSRTALPRQQTLRALIDWSYDLLNDEERDLFRRLSVFMGGWTFDAAGSVAEPLDTYSLLPQLVSKSLVTRDARDGEADGLEEMATAEPRYFFLETIRQYARDRLAESQQVEEARDRHFAYYEALAESVGFGAGPGASMLHSGGIAQEQDNLRAAAEWAVERYPDRLLNLLWNLSMFLSDQLQGTEFIDWVESALRNLEKMPPLSGDAAQARELTRLRGLTALGLIKMFLGQLAESDRLSREVNESLRERSGDDPLLYGAALFVRAQTDYFLEDPALEETIAQGLAYLRALGDHPAGKAMLAIGLMLAAETAARQGNLDLAEEHFNESTSILENSAREFLPWAEYSRLFMMERMDLDAQKIREQYNQTVATLYESRNSRLAAMVESDWAHKVRREGNFEEAMAIYRRMLSVWHELGHRAAVANVLENMAFIDRAQHRPERAVTLLGAAERIREEAGQDMLRPEREEYERELDALKAAMPAEAFKSRWARGRGLSTDALMALALETGEDGNG